MDLSENLIEFGAPQLSKASRIQELSFCDTIIIIGHCVDVMRLAFFLILSLYPFLCSATNGPAAGGMEMRRRYKK